MKVLKLFVILTQFLAFSSTQSYLSSSICAIIIEFYSKYSRNIDIIDINGTQGELTTDLVANLNESVSVTLKRSRGNITETIQGQTILLFDDFWSLSDFNQKSLINVPYINPIRIVVYCINATKSEISTLKTDIEISSYFYFIVIGRDSVIRLFTFENRKDLKVCHKHQQLVEINEFSSTTLQWMNAPVFPKKYKNFHGCDMQIGFNGRVNFETIKYRNGQPLDDVGLSLILLKLVAKDLNFRLICVLILNDTDENIALELYNFLQTSSIDGYALNEKGKFTWHSILMNIQCTPQLLIPPSDLYTSFEKMALPFDIETWIGFFAVLLIGLSVISFISNFLPKKIRDFIYGASNRTPSLNFFLGFFGEAQTNLPDRNFSRIIWVFFIFYCLVFRTTYQGKLFEFTTTEIRKPEMRTITELRENGFKLYLRRHSYTESALNVLRNEIGLEIVYVSSEDYERIYTQNLTDPSFHGVVLTSDIDHAMISYFSEMPLPRKSLLIPITSSQYAFGFRFPNLWNERLQNIMTDLITGGIINLHLERIIKSKWNLMPVENTSNKVILSLQHLGFGFQICFFSAYIAFLAFSIELVYFWCIRNYKHRRSLDISVTDEGSQMNSAVDDVEEDDLSMDSTYSELMRTAFGSRVFNTENGKSNDDEEESSLKTAENLSFALEIEDISTFSYSSEELL